MHSKTVELDNHLILSTLTSTFLVADNTKPEVSKPAKTSYNSIGESWQKNT